MTSCNAQAESRYLADRLSFESVLRAPTEPVRTCEGCHERWVLGGLLHRTEGPAEIMCSGEMRHYKLGKLHCETGPAVFRQNGENEYWLCGVRYTVEEWLGLMMLREKHGVRLVF